MRNAVWLAVVGAIILTGCLVDERKADPAEDDPYLLAIGEWINYEKWYNPSTKSYLDFKHLLWIGKDGSYKYTVDLYDGGKYTQFWVERGMLTKTSVGFVFEDSFCGELDGTLGTCSATKAGMPGAAKWSVTLLDETFVMDRVK